MEQTFTEPHGVPGALLVAGREAKVLQRIQQQPSGCKPGEQADTRLLGEHSQLRQCSDQAPQWA